MTKLAEIAARSASRTVSHWNGESLTTVIENTEPAVQAADADPTDERAEQRAAFRAELFATRHLMPVNGGHVHYGTPESYGNTDIPICRQGHGYHRISYYRPVDLPVTCTNCISRYGIEN